MTTADRERVAQSAQRRLARNADTYREAVASLEAARFNLARAVQLAHQAGIRQVDILDAIDHVWTREYVRKLTRPREIPWQGDARPPKCYDCKTDPNFPDHPRCGEEGCGCPCMWPPTASET